jgi:outer membrane protein assembly factor BamB
MQRGKSYALIGSWKGISSVEVQTGRPLWVYEWELYSGRHISDPIVLRDHVYISQNFFPAKNDLATSLLLAVSGEKPTVLWRSSDLTTEISDGVVLDGYLYGGQGGPYRFHASLRCVDLATGQLKWEKVVSESMSPACVSLMVAGGKLVVLTDDGVLAIAEASADAYKEISRCTLQSENTLYSRFWNPPVLCNGRIYCRNFFGGLICIDVRN